MPDFVPEKSKIFLLSPDECEEMSSFVRDQLWKGYIQPSSSPQMSPMFFVLKLETTAKRMCTDYWHLNKKTIKNNYPLLLISEMIDKIGDAKVFMKLDLRWGFNNVWIKEGDKWKAAFICYEGAFEPLVMYFRPTNSLSTLQR